MNPFGTKGYSPAKSLRRYGFTIGGRVLAGWLLGLRFLTTVMPDFTTMKPNTATCLVLAGLSLWLLRFRANQCVQLSPWLRWFAQICAMLVAFLALLTLGEHFLHLNLGLDQTLLRHTLTDVRLPPERLQDMVSIAVWMAESSSTLIASYGTDPAGVRRLGL
jgi:hypothetical protein